MRTILGTALVASFVLLGCGNSDEPYKPAPAWSGRKASLPPVPQLPSNPVKVGEAYTVHGAIHHLHSRIHEKDVTSKPITIQGYIVEENITDAPKCAVHKTGKKDSDDCQAEIPSFWIADEKDGKKKIRVLGFAKNFATVYDAMEKYKNLKEPPKEPFKDDMWSVDVPFPLPSVGAKVKVTGKYGFTFSKSSTGMVSDPASGVITYEKLETVEPAAQTVSFKNR